MNDDEKRREQKNRGGQESQREEDRISIEGVIREIDAVLERIEAFDPGKDRERQVEKEQSRRILEGVRETLLGAFADEYMSFHYWFLWPGRRP